MKRACIKAFSGGLVLCASIAMPSASTASVLVHVVQNDPTATNASIVPSSTLPSADFLSPDINFNINDSSTISLAVFLNNPVFFNTQNGFNAALAANNSFLEITGQTFLNAGSNSFVVGHDDGVVLSFADPTIGTVVNQPGPTAFVNTPFNVNAPASGLYSFDLKYVECCGGPADLVFRINGAPIGTALPEPATMALIGTGVLGIVAARRRRLAPGGAAASSTGG